MGRVPITIMGYKCELCGHEWIPNDIEKEPKTCPKCGSLKWNSPKAESHAMSYEEFRDRIEAMLKSSAESLTWTEIRTGAKLAQKFPNNQWVHRLEKDIFLLREKDKNGIIRWKLTNNQE